MANLESTEEARTAGGQVATADLIIGIPASTDAEELRQRAGRSVGDLIAAAPSLKVIVAYPGNSTGDAIDFLNQDSETGLRFLEYTPQQGAPASAPWLGLSSACSTLRDIAEKAGAHACVVLGADLTTFNVESLRVLAQPVLDQRAELVMPIYPASKYEGLLNSAILYPMTRALFGRKVRFPVASDFGASIRMLGRIAQQPGRGGPPGNTESVVWAATEAAVTDSSLVQAYLGARHVAQNDGLDLSTVLGHLVGSLFADVDKYAAFWQRVRGAQPTSTLGSPGAPVNDGEAADIRPMLESFNLGSRNLQEVWSLVLTPVTLLDVRRLSRVTPESFRIPDALWVRIMYDFALAYRLRTISRAHLLGALTPLYLGWVASYVQEIAAANSYTAEQRIEQLAKAFEEGKPYLVSRWRWPDRFNP